MSRLRLRTTSWITSYIVFLVVLFGTIESIEGLQCYSCKSVNGGNTNCENMEHVPSLPCSTWNVQDLGLNISNGTLNSKSLMTLEENSRGNNSLRETISRMHCSRKETYASSSSYACSKGTIIVTVGGKTTKTFIRGCDDLTALFCLCVNLPTDQIEEISLSTCNTDNCNSSGRIEIGATSLILSLLVLLRSKI